ncbi:MAG: DUF111 family protein [Anaerolineales bacterium]|jgi:uncharacterized protein (DUF111 family)
MLMLVNVDHVNGEALPYFIESLMAKGAQNVHVVQAITKKGRWEFLIFVDAPEEKIEPLGDFLVSELGTIGLRVFETRHVKFDIQFLQFRLIIRKGEQELYRQPVRVKLIQNNRGETGSIKAEYEDLKSCVEQLLQIDVELSLSALKKLVEHMALQEKRAVYKDLSLELQAVKEVETG